MTKLRRSLGLTSLTFYGVGLIVGAGVYSVIGAAAGVAGEGLWWSVALAAVAALLTGLSYAELAAAMPDAGTEYAYVGRALPRRPWAPFAIAFTRVVAGAATAATVALAFAGYLEGFVDVPRWAAAAALLAVCLAVNVAGIRESTWVNVVFTSIETLGLVAVLVVAWRDPEFGDALATPPGASVVSGAALIFFVYLGFEGLASFAEETKDPARALPRAILLSLAITTVLYVAVAVAVVALLPPERLAQSASPLADAVAAASPRVGRLLGGVALFATANTVLVALVTTSRLLYGMARDLGSLPALAAVSPKRRTPWAAAVAVTLGGAALVPLGDVSVVASFASLGSLLAFAAVHAALIALRVREPDLERPFRVPWTVGRVPVLPALGGLASIALAATFGADVYLAAGVAVALGLGVYVFARRRGAAIGRGS